MKVQTILINEPKNEKAAKNQAIYFLNSIEILKKRKENIMNNKIKVSEKIQKLQDTLKEYESQLEELDTSSSTWETLLSDIKSKWNLTEAEILELRSSLLRTKIAELEKEANIQKLETKNI